MNNLYRIIHNRKILKRIQLCLFGKDLAMWKLTRFFLQFSLIMIFWVLGLGIQHLFHLKISGDIIGLILLLIFLLTGFLRLQSVDVAGKFLIQHLVLFFIPCVVGLIQFKELFISYGFQVIVTVVFSTICVLISTVYSVYWGARLEGRFTKEKTKC